MRLLCIGAIAVLSACGGDSTGPQGPGTLRATLASPNGAEGAAVFELSGSGFGAVTPLTANTFVASGVPTRVTVVLTTPGTIAFEVAVDELTRPPTIAIEEVSGPDNALRTPLSRYKVSWARVAAPARVSR
jgi:hypothetical protein